MSNVVVGAKIAAKKVHIQKVLKPLNCKDHKELA